MHVAAQIYILIMYRFDGAIVQAKNIRCVYCNTTESLYPTPDCKPVSTSSKEKKVKYKTKLKLAIGDQKYRIDKPVLNSTFCFFIGINYMLLKINDLMTAKCAFALKDKGRKTEIRNE